MSTIALAPWVREALAAVTPMARAHAAWADRERRLAREVIAALHDAFALEQP